jgi:hypothetical protein
MAAAILWSATPATRALLLQAIEEQAITSRTSNSIANMQIRTNLKSQRWDSESSRMDGLTDTRVHKQVAMAKLSTKKIQSVCGGYGGI